MGVVDRGRRIAAAQGQPGHVLRSRPAGATLNQPTDQPTNPQTRTQSKNLGDKEQLEFKSIFSKNRVLGQSEL